MISRTDAGAATRSDAARALRRAEVERYLDDNLPREPGTKIQYGHPSPRYWETRGERLDELLRPRRSERSLALYVHVPFCPPTTPEACGFCLFAREDLGSYKLVADYVDDVLVELEAHAAILGRCTLRAVYFGGGTPNVLKPEDIRRLLERVAALFDVAPATEVTFEGTPALFTPDRLDALVELGVNRVSIGAQVLAPHLIAHSGRKQTQEQVRRAIEFCRDHGLRCSVDLITGWFEQSAEDLVGDVELLERWGATEIVNHPLTLAGDSEFARRCNELPPVESVCRSFLAARERMLELGFRADSYTDYCRTELPPVEYLALYRDPLRNDRVGVGYGANSMLAGDAREPGHTYKNVVGLEPYRSKVRGLASGASCVDTSFRFTAADIRLLYVLKGLEGAPALSASAYAAEFGCDLRADFEAHWGELERRGWLAWNGDRPALVGDGVFYTSTVQRCLAEARNAELRK